MESLSEKFENRGYPGDVIKKAFKKATAVSRRDLIYGQRKVKNGRDNKVRLIFTYNSKNPPLHKWLREGRQFLVTPEGKEIGKNLQIVNRQPRNLKQMVTGVRHAGDHSRVPPSDNPGCFKCGKCKVGCPVLEETKSFRSRNTKKQYNVVHHLTCDSSFVIYLVSCKRCGGQYVGKATTTFKKRHSNHRQEVKNNIGGLGHHFGPTHPCKYEDMSIILIEQIKQGDRKNLEKREQYWQHQLRVFVENGGNAMCIRKDYT